MGTVLQITLNEITSPLQNKQHVVNYACSNLYS